MTEIAIRDAQPAAELVAFQDDNIARLARWAEQADSAVRIADIVVNTKMCPSAYRGKTQEAAAAILAGAEMQLSPMASLRAFDDIKGTPAPKAITLRAVVQSRGHDLEVIEATPVRAIVEGRRRGSDRWQRIEWTIERAEQAGYVAQNAKYRTDPTAQLVARATAEMARWLDSAAIMGLAYSSEEVADAGAHVQSVTRQVTAGDIVAQAAGHVALERAAPQASSQQLADIRELFDTHGYSDPATRRKLVAEAVGRDVAALNELTATEADAVATNIAIAAAGGATDADIATWPEPARPAGAA